MDSPSADHDHDTPMQAPATPPRAPSKSMSRRLGSVASKASGMIVNAISPNKSNRVRPRVYISFKTGDEFFTGFIQFVMNRFDTEHIPFHRREEGDTIADIRRKIVECNLVIVFADANYISSLGVTNIADIDGEDLQIHDESSIISEVKRNQTIPIACDTATITHVRNALRNTMLNMRMVEMRAPNDPISDSFWWSRYVDDPRHVFIWDIDGDDVITDATFDRFITAVTSHISMRRQ